MILELNYIGNDSFSRPCYETPEGRILVDVQPISTADPEICTKPFNRLDGEPDTLIQHTKTYEAYTEIKFKPQRIVWW